MTESRKLVLRETLTVLIGELIGTALMYGIYALLGKFSVPVLLGGLVGTVLATGNFFFMAVVATLAADRAEQQDVEGGKRMLKGSYPLRLLVLAGVLEACALSGWFDVLAMALPLVFVRFTLTIAEFIKKKGA